MEEDSSGLPIDPEELQTVIEEAETRAVVLQGCIAQEEAKMEAYKVRGGERRQRERGGGGERRGIIIILFFQLENIRRKHNYLPLIMEVLKILAKKGELVKLVEQVSLLAR